jgi:alpha-D-xyloside xylohydrolase
MARFICENDRLVFNLRGQRTQIEAWGKDSLRVRSTPLAQIMELAGSLLPPTPTTPVIDIGDDRASIINGKVRLDINREGKISIIDVKTGASMLADDEPLSFKGTDGGLYKAEARFTSDPAERIYGLGQHRHGFLNQKGCVMELTQRNTHITIPFYLSSKGYGFLWHNPGQGRVELANNWTRWVAYGTRQIDYVVCVGDTPAEIMRRYCDWTGYPPNMPSFATGFWQCKLRYSTQDELLSIAREYKKRNLPISVIVIDYFHWTLQGEWKFDPQCWPDPQAMVDELKEMGIELMVSIWPTVNQDAETFKTMEAEGYLVCSNRGLNVQLPFLDNGHEGTAYLHYFDATHPGAREFIWDRAKNNYHRYGIKMFWLDNCEPDINPHHDQDNLRYHLGSGTEVGCLYPMLNTQAFYDGLKASGETEIISLNRSAWAGSQRFGAAVWSGDVHTTFDELGKQIRAGLNMAMSGIPWWTTDIGGFWGGNHEDPAYRELIIRWFQWACFCPIMRLHGCRQPMISPKQGGPNEAWSYGEEAYGIIKQLLNLRERLRPYIADQMVKAHATGLPPMRPLFFDFPEADCSAVDDQYLFGPDILVAPVYEIGVRKRKVYLPKGAEWIDTLTNKKVQGGITVESPAPLARIPVFVRTGSSAGVLVQ